MKRYSWSTDFMEWCDDGGYVLFSDHEEEVSRLRAEAKGLSQSLADAFADERECAEEINFLRAEVEGLRVDAMRYRWLCEDHADAATRLRRNDLLEHFRVRSYSANSTAIDAAMGASA